MDKKQSEQLLNNKDGSHQGQTSRLVKSAASMAMLVSVLLIVIKAFAWGQTGASSILTSLADSSLDLVVSFMNFLAIRIAFSPADSGHPFGHGKAESLAALMQSAFIFGSAFVLALHSIERLINPIEIADWHVGMWVMIISTALTVSLVLYQRWVAKRTGSLAVKADSAHYSADILANISIVIAMLLSSLHFLWVDPVVSCVIILMLIKSAYGIAKEALDMLMDHSLGDEFLTFIEEQTQKIDGIMGYHDLKSRKSGNKEFIQIHLDMSPNITLRKAHDLGQKLEQAIIDIYPRAEVIVHHDPIEQ